MTHLTLTLIYLQGATTIDMKYNCQIIIYPSWEGFKLRGFKILSDIKTELKNGSRVIYSLLNS